MRRQVGIGLAVILLLSLATPLNAATPKPGSTCSKSGITKNASGKKFTCVKQGKRLIWNKGVAIKAGPARVPAPTSTFTPPARPTSWSELVSKSSGITYWAWKLAQERMTKLGPVTTEFVIHIGPNTVMNLQQPEKILKLVAGFYSNTPQVKTTHVAFFDFEDVSWAQEIDKRFSTQPRPNEVAMTCRSKTVCNGGNAYIDSKMVGFNYVSSSPTTRSDMMKANGETVAHEYFHVIQLYPMFEAITKGINPVWMPDWIREGSAEWFATSVTAKEFTDLTNYQRFRSEVELYRDRFSAESVSKVLSSNNGQSDNGWLAYNVGAKVIEALVVLKGVDSILDFYKLGAKGESFESAFQSIYGISWAEAKPILSEAIANHYK
jgi:hypothetical protein